MKNFWNILLIASATIALALFFTIQYLGAKRIEAIAYDKKIDAIALNLCNEDRVLQYYMVSTDYNGGKRAVKNRLLPLIEKERVSFGTQNGNITIRFVVNCEGETGLFRAKSVDENLKETDFDPENIAYLISIVSQLEDWIVKAENDKKYDSYYFINFKIRNGAVTDIF